MRRPCTRGVLSLASAFSSASVRAWSPSATCQRNLRTSSSD
ncbi:MAG: hypothetical protein AVDCRST_MAG90-2447, partial [uncultured Microvirga sp.]